MNTRQRGPIRWGLLVLTAPVGLSALAYGLLGVRMRAMGEPQFDGAGMPLLVSLLCVATVGYALVEIRRTRQTKPQVFAGRHSHTLSSD